MPKCKICIDLNQYFAYSKWQREHSTSFSRCFRAPGATRQQQLKTVLSTCFYSFEEGETKSAQRDQVSGNVFCCASIKIAVVKKFSFISLIFTLLVAVAAVMSGCSLFPGVGVHKWGFIDKTGKVVIPATFDDVARDTYGGFIWPSRRPFHNFSEGLCAVRIGPKWGFIDKTGKLVIPAKFDTAGAFCEGLACVREGKKLGYVNKTGAYVIPLQFDWPNIEDHTDTPDLDFSKEIISKYEFGDGLAPASIGGKWGYIDKQGKFVVQPRYMECTPFLNGIGSSHNVGGLVLFDNTGKVISDLKGTVHSYAEDVSIKMVSPITDIQHRFVYVNKQGEQVIPTEFADAREFSEGLACVAPIPFAANENQAYGYIDHTGKLVIPAGFYVSGNNMASAFIDGRAIVTKMETDAMGNNHMNHGVIDKTGRWVVPPKYNSISAYREGVARVFDDLKSFFIDKNGAQVCTAPTTWCNSFSDGLAAFMQ